MNLLNFVPYERNLSHSIFGKYGKIGIPNSFPKREDMVKDNQSSYATVPLKDNEEVFTYVLCPARIEFYLRQRNGLCRQGSSSILQVCCCKDKCFAGLSISGQRTSSQV
jgi:hypothetical protein